MDNTFMILYRCQQCGYASQLTPRKIPYLSQPKEMRCQIICPGCTKKLIFSQFSWSVLGELLGVGGNLDFMIELPEVLLPDGPQVKFESAPGSTPKVIFLKEDVERAEPMPKYKGTDFISIDDYIEAMNKGAISDDETDYNFDDLMEDLDSEGNKA